MCAGVSEDMLGEAFYYQSMAADRGGEAMRQQLVLRPALDRRNFLSDLEGWTDYRQRAAQYVDELLRRRNVNDMVLLLSIYAPDDVQMPRPPYMRKDDATFLALIEVAKRNSLALPAYIATAADNLISEPSAAATPGVAARVAEIGSGWSAGAAMIDPALAMSPKFAAEACQ